MSWVEFQLRLIGYQRSLENEMMRSRELHWQIYTAPHRDPKKLSKNIDQFWPLKGVKKSGPTEKQKEAFFEAMKEYKEKTKNKES